MIITEILKTLSDVELIVLAEEINNPNVQMWVILNQLAHKTNDIEQNKSLLENMPQSWIAESLAYELSLRLKLANELKCDCGEYTSR